MSGRFAKILILLLFGGTPGCELFQEPSVCTTRGCLRETGLYVHVAPISTITQSVRVEVFPLGLDRPPVHVHECSGSLCDQNVFFKGLIVERATIRVTTDAGVRVTEVRPVYYTEYPNGRGCPTCVYAQVGVPS